jgi:hypothetical protein
MIHSLLRKYPVGSNPVFLKAGHVRRVTSCVVALVVVSVLLLVGHSFGWDVWEAPSGQPEQMWSQVHYDPKPMDTFFESDEWSYPHWMWEDPDGRVRSNRFGDKNPVENPPRLKHTAKCFSTSFEVKHVVKFCEARLLDGHTIDFLVHEMNPAFRDSLRVRIRNGKFRCQYWITDDVGAVT